MLAGAHPGMVADDLADYLFARSTGHFASLMTLIARGCRRAVRTGTEKLTRDLLDQVRNDAAAEAARQELLAAFDAGKLSARPPPPPGRKPWRQAEAVHGGHPDPAAPAARRGARQLAGSLRSPAARHRPRHLRLRRGGLGPGQRRPAHAASRGSYQLDEPDLAALSAVTGVPAADAGRHDAGPLPGHRPGRGDRPARHAADPALVAAAVRLPLLPALPGRQRRPVDARLADPVGLRLHRLPGAARRHLPRLRPAAPAHPHRAAPPARPLRPHRPAAAAIAPAARRHHRPAPATPPPRQPSRCPPAGTCWPPSSTSTPSSPRCSPHEAGQRKQPPCSSTWTTSTRSPAPPSQPSTGRPAPPAAATAVLDELGARPGSRRCRERARQPGGAGCPGSSRPSPRSASPSPTSCCTAGATTPTRVIAAWLAGNTASRRSTTSPADILIHWGRASPALQAALARPLAARLDTFYQLRYRAVAGPARIPDPARAGERAAALPSLLWPGWALRLMPPGGFDFLRYRAALAVMLAIAVTGAEDYRTAQELLGLEPVHASRLATFTARLRQHGILEPVTAAICQLARKLDEHGAPIDYARRRRLRRFSQARLDAAGWRRQRYFLTHPAPGRTAVTSTSACPPPRSRSSSPGSA